jgi:hypothetical protein
MKTLLVGVAAVLSICAMAQPSSAPGQTPSSLGSAKKQTPPAVITSGPVTQAEAAEVLRKVERAYTEVKAASPDQPVTRGFLIEQMERLFQLSQPHFKFTPRKVAFDAKVLSLPAGHPNRKSLEKMIAWGAVDRVGTLATSPKPSLSPQEFGDAVGFFVARMADLTHMPSYRWSPYLNGGDPDRHKPG